MCLSKLRDIDPSSILCFILYYFFGQLSERSISCTTFFILFSEAVLIGSSRRLGVVYPTFLHSFIYFYFFYAL